ncbi:MAG: sensor domain-containing diguanylate cyclase [Nitrospira sp.]|nr:sensor domain-containing diguanylate cyclase [Nitrospira sp.]
MRRLSPLTFLSIGLVSLTVSLLLAGDAMMGLIPAPQQHVAPYRKAFSEMLAVQFSLLVERGDLAILQSALGALVERTPEIAGAALMTGTGQVLAHAGLAVPHWDASQSAVSTGLHVLVPIYRGADSWGVLQIVYRQPEQGGSWDWLFQPWVRFVLFVAAVGFVSYRLLLKRVLRHLDPSAVVPPRVKAALDTLVEGVAMLDVNGLIVLANEAFLAQVGQPLPTILGQPLTLFPWVPAENQDGRQGGELPWHRAVTRGGPQQGMRLDLQLPDGGRRLFMVTAAPILDDRGGLRGTIVAFHDVTALETKSAELARTVTGLVAAQVELMQRTDELHRLATRDPLTGCFNRRAFFEQVEAAMQDPVRVAAGVGCVMIDIDHFKAFNDRYGHAVGDQVLVAVAQAMVGAIRDGDMLGRYGGEEFCLVLTGAPLEVVLQTAERIRCKIEAESGAAVRTPAGLQVTASLGVAYVTGHEDIHGVLSLADQALYFAKQTGRNRVAVFNRDRAQPEPVSISVPARAA